MSSSARRSPSPTQVGFSVLSRRQLLAGAGTAGAAAFLAACGSSASTSSVTTKAASGATTTGAATGGATTAAAAAGKATGSLTFGSNYSDDKPKAAIQAMIDAFPNKNVKVSVNTVDHNKYQENITNYLQQPDDIVSWFAGYRMRFFASKGLVGDISDVWKNLGELSDAFKKAATGDDGKQYFVPLYYYPWAVHYRKSLFADKGYKVPTTWDEFKALADKMKSDLSLIHI